VEVDASVEVDVRVSMDVTVEVVVLSDGAARASVAKRE
jgi:hypothetical protein